MGHLKWTFMQCEMKDNCFARNYWVNGKIMPQTGQLAPDTPTDTPFQILKAFEYYLSIIGCSRATKKMSSS
jgi:hypothetical protein